MPTRDLYLVLGQNTTAPAGVLEDERQRQYLRFDLVSLFHNGYIEIWGSPPVPGTNPFLSVYHQRLTPGPWLIWRDPGIGTDTENRRSQSNILGRIFARGFLTQHCGFRWFASIQDLQENPQRGWEATRTLAGDMPDWLVTRYGQAALAEAKGTQEAIDQNKAIVQTWRNQFTRVAITKDRNLRTLKSWIAATRWVTVNQPRTKPIIFVEDPPASFETQLSRNEFEEVEFWSACVHTSKNLERIGFRRLSREVASSRESQWKRKAKYQVWRCHYDGLSEFRFIGRPRANFSPRYLQFLCALSISPRSQEEEYVLDELKRQFWDTVFFDGLEISVIKNLITGEVPPYFFKEPMRFWPPYQVSMLEDGSLLAPFEYMELDDVVEF